MIQRCFSGERGSVVDLQQNRLQSISDEYVQSKYMKGHSIVVLFGLRRNVVVP